MIPVTNPPRLWQVSTLLSITLDCGRCSGFPASRTERFGGCADVAGIWGCIRSTGREGRQSRLESLLNALGVGCRQSVLLTQAPVRPKCSVVPGCKIVEFSEKSIAQFGRCLWSEHWLGGIRANLSIAAESGSLQQDLADRRSAGDCCPPLASQALTSGWSAS